MAKRTTIPVNEFPANPEPTLTPDALLALLAEVKALREAVAAKPAQPTKGDKSAQNAWAAQKAFTKKGYKDVQPGVTILTYNKWIEAGFRVKPGEHALKINNLRLFHKSQVEAMSAKDKAAALANLKEKAAKRSATVVPINQPSA